MNKFFLIMLCLMASSVATLAQRHMIVADVETLLPVGSASVQTCDRITTTDSTGCFALQDSCRTIIVSHMNYESRIVNTDELSGDTVFIISKLIKVREVIVFGKGMIDDERIRELNRRLQMAKTEAQLMNATPNGNLFGLLNYLIPKKWRKGYREAQRRKHHDDVLREY